MLQIDLSVDNHNLESNHRELWNSDNALGNYGDTLESKLKVLRNYDNTLESRRNTLENKRAELGNYDNILENKRAELGNYDNTLEYYDNVTVMNLPNTCQAHLQSAQSSPAIQILQKSLSSLLTLWQFSKLQKGGIRFLSDIWVRN